MLQQRVKHMRIVQLTPAITRPQSPLSQNRAQSDVHSLTTMTLNKTGVIAYPNTAALYMPSFKGYESDKNFINNAINMLDNTLDDVNSVLSNTFEENYNNEFLNALEYAKKDKELYKKITESPELFDKIETGFNIFNENILKSVDDVRYEQKVFTPFWENSSRIGEEKTADIIKNAVNNKFENINKVIKKSDEKDYETIKSALVKAWFNTAYKVIKEEKPQTITKNFKELSETVNQQYAKTFVLNEQTRLCNEFNEKTKGRILAQDSDFDKKQRAFKLMLSYLQNKLLEDKGTQLDKDYSSILNAKSILEYAKEKESLFYARYAINILHGLAFEKWEKDNLVPALNIKLKKEIFYNKEEKKNEELKKFQNYRNFDTDGKYFVARYYDACCKENDKYNFDSRDYIWQIINNRHNTKPASQAIKELSLAVKEKQDFYFEQLDNFYDMLQQKNYIPEIQMPQRQVDTPNDKLSFADLYLEKLGKINSFKKNSEEEKLNYLSKLTKSEMILLNTEIKKDWYKNDQKYSLLAQVNEQARNSSVFLEMYNELKKININLEDIKIKTNEMTVSLKDALENRTIVSQQIQDDSAIKLSAQISQMQRDYNLLPAEHQKIVDEKFSEIIPAIITAATNSKTDDNVKKDLRLLSQMAKQKAPANKILNKTKSILLSHCIIDGMNDSARYLKHIADISKTAKITNNLSWANLGLNTTTEDSPFGEFFDMMPDLNPLEAVQQAGVGIATAAGGLAAKSSIMSAAGAALGNPVVAGTVIALLVAGGGAVLAAQKAKKLEHSQRDLIFEVEV